LHEEHNASIVNYCRLQHCQGEGSTENAERENDGTSISYHENV